MDLLNGTVIEKPTSFWKMWCEDLPGSFPKTKLTKDLQQRWGLAYSNVYGRLKKEDFMHLQSDLLFLFNHYGIAFDYKTKGFFLDKRQYDLIRENEELEAAQMFGLSK